MAGDFTGDGQVTASADGALLLANLSTDTAGPHEVGAGAGLATFDEANVAIYASTWDAVWGRTTWQSRGRLGSLFV